MRIRLALVLVAALPTGAFGQERLPADIHPVTLSRMPPVNRAELDAEGQKALDARTTQPMPAPGPGSVTVWSPRATEGLGAIGRALGVPRGDTFPLGPRSISSSSSSRRARSISSTSGARTSPRGCAWGSSSR